MKIEFSEITNAIEKFEENKELTLDDISKVMDLLEESQINPVTDYALGCGCQFSRGVLQICPEHFEPLLELEEFRKAANYTNTKIISKI